LVERLEERQLLSAVPTLTSLRVSTASLTYGQSEQLTATVTATPSNSGTPTGGTVTFLNGSTTLGTAALHSGTATLQVSTLPAGTDVVMANYSGDGANFAGSSTVVAPNSIITTVAGNGQTTGNGDGGPATAATLFGPENIATDAAGNLFIADFINNRIREVNHSTGVITTVAGNGIAGLSGDNGQATAAELADPTGLALDALGNLFIADSGNNRVCEVNHSTGVITTVAGNGTQGYRGDNVLATAAELCNPEGVAVDGTGHLFIADTGNSYIVSGNTLIVGPGNDRIREVNLSTGVITTVAGNGTVGYSGDNGPATAAELGNPAGIAVDSAGHLFIADTGDNTLIVIGKGAIANPGERIREVILSTGVITTVAGNGTVGYSGDNGQATAAELSYPSGVAVDASGDLFIADFENNRIREVNLPTGVITTVAGNGTAGYSGDNGPATAAELNWPGSIAVDAVGDLFIADQNNNRIREVASGAVVNVSPAPLAVTAIDASKLYGAADPTFSVSYSGFVNGDNSSSLGGTLQFTTNEPGNGYAPAGTYQITPSGLTSGNYTITFTGGTLSVSPAATTTTLTVSAAVLIYGQSLTLSATVNAVLPSAATPTGGTVTFFNGIITLGTAALNSGTATLPISTLPEGADLVRAIYSGSGNFAGSSTMLGPNSSITTVAGNGTAGYSDDGILATAAQLINPSVVATDAAGNLFFADGIRVREVNHLTGVITTVAGNGVAGYGGDNGQATAAGMEADPAGIALDSAGDLFIADLYAQRVREVNFSTGVITTVAGNGKCGFAGDGGQATAAELGGPSGVAVDGAGNLFIADSNNARIREVDLSTGVITTIAGTGSWGFSGDNGQATAAELDYPSSLAVDAAGDLFIGDVNNNRIRVVNHATGVITTVAGNGTSGYNGDNGPANAAQLAGFEGLALDGAGDLFIAANDRIRVVNHATGVITTVAGDGTWGYSGDNGPANAAELNVPWGVALDATGNLFIADRTNNRIREVASGAAVVNMIPAALTVTAKDASKPYDATDPTFSVSYAGFVNGDNSNNLSGTLQFRTTEPGSGYAPAGTYQITPSGLTSGNYTITFASGTLTVSPAATTTTVTAAANPQGFGQLLTATVTADLPSAATPTGGSVTFFSGNVTLGTASLHSGSATLQVSTLPVGTDMVTASYSGDGADFAGSSTVIGPNSIITTVAGNGNQNYNGDGIPATAAQLFTPASVAVDSEGDLFIADLSNNRIREVNHATGVITTVAGKGTPGYGGDNGPATAAALSYPSGVAVDAAGNLFIADSDNCRVREVNHATGVITTVAGNGSFGSSGDGGQATAAELERPTGLAVDAVGDIFIADYYNNRIREVNFTTGVITTVAGNGTGGFSGDNGPATAAELRQSEKITFTNWHW
jgi:hypothetical protein